MTRLPRLLILSVVVAALAVTLSGRASVAARETGDEAIYRSPIHGYSVTYDTDEWDIDQENSYPDEQVDVIALFSSSQASRIIIIGEPARSSVEPADCVASDVQSFLRGDDAVSEIEPVDDRDAEGEADDRAWATYDFVYELESGNEVELTAYFECRIVGDGVLVHVIHEALSSAYEEEVAARESLLAGFAPAPEGCEKNELSRCLSERAARPVGRNVAVG